ncbi:MAG: EF-Tu/IF-2/RF-3 family GTPase, partial [Candidatus Woesearchaeota archaeon]
GSEEARKALQKKAPIHEVVLNAVVKHLPNPVQASPYRIPKIWHGDVESEFGRSLIEANPKGPAAFVVTKITIDPQAGEICAGRIFSGTIKRGDTLYLNKAKQNNRVQQVFIYNGAKREIVDGSVAGNIIGIGGLKDAFPGETATTGEQTPFEAISHIFDPVITKAIEAKRPQDLPKLVEVLIQVNKEDPGVQIEINQETGEHLMSGMGELHLEIIENRILTEKGVEIVTSPPVVVYREAIMKPAPEDAEGKSPNKHNRLYFTAQPIPANIAEAIKSGKVSQGRVKNKDREVWEALVEAGMETKEARSVRDIFNGNILIDGTRGIVQIGEIQEMVNDMFEDVMNKGPIAHEPCIGVMVTLTDAKLHEDAIHRGPAQLYPAVRDGIRAAIAKGRPLLYEPIQTLMFDTPETYVGEISKLISNKRGQLLDMQADGSMQQITAKIPVGEMFGMSNDLRSATGGRGSSSVIQQSYEKLPEELQQKIIEQIRSRKGLSANE